MQKHSYLISCINNAILTPAGPTIFTATQAKTSFPLTCPTVLGDCVFLYWQSSSSGKKKLVYHYDRWRGNTPSVESANLQLAGSPYNADAGSFSFLYTPGLKDGGLYVCDVLVNEHIFSQWTLMSVLKGQCQELGREREKKKTTTTISHFEGLSIMSQATKSCHADNVQQICNFGFDCLCLGP